MAGLLGQGFDDPRSAAIMALSGGLLRGDMGAGLLGANQAYGNAQNDAMKRQFLQAQMQEIESQRQMQMAKAQREQQELARQARIQQALPGMFRQPGMAGGEAVPQTQGGIPMFSQPMGAAPMRPTQGGFDVQQAIRLGMSPDEITKYAGLENIGRPKATRQMEVDDGKGGKRIALVDDFGQEVAGFSGYTAPVQVNQGDRVTFAKPTPGLSLPVGMSPDAKASNALGWANHGISSQRLAFDRAGGAEGGKPPAGYRWNADRTGMEFIPGGPADPNAAKRAAPTEFQGKSSIYGTRAQEADRIINELDGKYSPAAINAKTGAANVPLVGGALEAAGNMALTANGQKAEQAQRDFINAVLRQESGAVISKEEFANAQRQYFPQPFDSPAVKLQKAQNRKLAVQGILNNARGTVEAQSGGASGGWGVAGGSPSVDDLVKKYGGK
jgi:hypothetical protein